MFSEKINTLMTLTGASAADLAALAGFDRSNISRLRSGKRVPSPDSSTVAKLIEGIYLFSDSRNDLKALCSLTGANENDPADTIRQSIREYLYDGCDLSAVKNTGSAAKVSSYNTFRERFNTSMELSGLSNIRLSRLIHSDPSLISRYRTGVRTPASNPELSRQLGEVLYERIIKKGREEELSRIMKIPVSELDDDVFISWLFNRQDDTEDSVLAAESLLQSFDSFTQDRASSLPAIEDIISETDTGNPSGDSVYYGITGLRRAVIRFLTTAIQTGAGELYLYSDEDQSWLTSDPGFLSEWSALMIACIKGGTRIYIIHNADRRLDEMTEAIRSWLPLYMSGMIESYSCRKQRNSRFFHTFFLMPSAACVRSFGVASATSEHIYHYYTDERTLGILMAEYNALLKSSTPLIKPLPSTVYPDTSDVIIIQSTLSVATMSRELAESFNSPSLMAIWERAHNALLDKLKKNHVCECIPLADAEAVRAGAARLSRIAVERKKDKIISYSYTYEQYLMHIKCITGLLDAYSSYRFYPIPEPPFPNIGLLISDNITKITPAIRPGLSFSIVHPSMCQAFQGYANMLIDQWKTDRNSVKKHLFNRLL